MDNTAHVMGAMQAEVQSDTDPLNSSWYLAQPNHTEGAHLKFCDFCVDRSQGTYSLPESVFQETQMFDTVPMSTVLNSLWTVHLFTRCEQC